MSTLELLFKLMSGGDLSKLIWMILKGIFA